MPRADAEADASPADASQGETTIDADDRSDGGDAEDAAPGDAQADGASVDAVECGATVAGYCGSDAGTCRTLFGPVFATDLANELARVCSTSARASVVTCGDYTIVTAGGGDTSVSLYYLRSTGALVTIDESSVIEQYVCRAGMTRYPVECSMDAEVMQLCAPDGATD